MAQYDAFAKKYDEWMATPFKKYAWSETVKRNLANIEGKKVLDVACGTGQSIAILHQLGVGDVVGIDVSSETIKIAKARFPEDIFVVGDISKKIPDVSGEFDVITAIFLLEYASSKKDLESMISNIYKKLKLGGTFYSLTVDPLVISDLLPYYGITGTKPTLEGEKYVYTLNNEKSEPLHPVKMFFWKIKTIESLLKKEGFTNFERLPVYVSEEGIQKYGKDYWKEFLTNPMYIIFKVTK